MAEVEQCQRKRTRPRVSHASAQMPGEQHQACGTGAEERHVEEAAGSIVAVCGFQHARGEEGERPASEARCSDLPQPCRKSSPAGRSRAGPLTECSAKGSPTTPDATSTSITMSIPAQTEQTISACSIDSHPAMMVHDPAGGKFLPAHCRIVIARGRRSDAEQAQLDDGALELNVRSARLMLRPQFEAVLIISGCLGGSYTFRSLASFAGGRPNAATESYQQNFRGAGDQRSGHQSEHPRVFVLRPGRMARGASRYGQPGNAIRPDED